jgi:phosphatidylglycerophosphate synthase
MYEYRRSIKSNVSDELINTYLLRPLAGILVRILYRTSVTPNQVTIASTVAGFAGALAYLIGDPLAIAIGGLLVTTKDLLDSADGQLARAKQLYSRLGRFLDSISDFFVNLAVFAAIGWILSERYGGLKFGVLALLGFAGITFRVSYHVFYQTSFLHLNGAYELNRVTEDVREEDRSADTRTLLLQKIFQRIYGWQDRIVIYIDRWCSGGLRRDAFEKDWYSDTTGLVLAGFIGMGTELFVLMVCSLFDNLELYLYLNVVLMNCVFGANILYRRFSLRSKLG